MQDFVNVLTEFDSKTHFIGLKNTYISNYIDMMNLPNAIDVSVLETQLMKLTVDSESGGGCIQDIILLNNIKNSSIVKTDDDGELQVYCSRDPKTEFEYGIRGVIYNKEKMVYRGFPYTEEMNTQDHRISKLDLSSLRMTKSYEGTLLRLFHFNGRWYLTTHRKLNAFMSRWTGTSTFGDQFAYALTKYGYRSYDAFLEKLDPELRYHFLLINNAKTRIVIKPELQNESIYLVLVTKDDDVPILPFPKVGTIPPSEELYFKDKQELLNYVDAINPFEFQGVLLYSQDYKKQYRILNNKYQKYIEVRNNISCLKYCYAVCRHDEEKRKLYMELYPDCIEIVKWYDERINIIAQELFSVYKLRHISKQYVIVSPERHGILQAIQRRYVETKKPVQIEDVLFVINTYGYPNRVHKIVNRTDKIGKAKIGVCNN